jgi:hypothetical protein
MVRMVEEGPAFRGFQHAALMELRIRTCHVRGSFVPKGRRRFPPAT